MFVCRKSYMKILKRLNLCTNRSSKQPWDTAVLSLQMSLLNRTPCLLKHVFHGHREGHVCQIICVGVCAYPQVFLFWSSFDVSSWWHLPITCWDGRMIKTHEWKTLLPSLVICSLTVSISHWDMGGCQCQGRHSTLSGDGNHVCVLWTESWTWCWGDSKTPEAGEKRVKQRIEKERKPVGERENEKEKEDAGEPMTRWEARPVVWDRGAGTE